MVLPPLPPSGSEASMVTRGRPCLVVERQAIDFWYGYRKLQCGPLFLTKFLTMALFLLFLPLPSFKDRD